MHSPTTMRHTMMTSSLLFSFVVVLLLLFVSSSGANQVEMAVESPGCQVCELGKRLSLSTLGPFWSKYVHSCRADLHCG